MTNSRTSSPTRHFRQTNHSANSPAISSSPDPDEKKYQRYERRRSLNGGVINTMNTIQEKEIVANIQEIQRKLSMLRHNDDKTESLSLNPMEHLVESRLLMVSNRLPVSITPDPNHPDGYTFQMSSGGLVTALAGIRKQLSFIWVGWLGIPIPAEDQAKVSTILLRDFNCVPVFLTKEIAHMYYNEFSNNILWPVFHYVPLTMSKAGSEKKFDFKLWEAYQIANQEFEKVVSEIYVKDDFVWVHDYHLMVLPSLLRARFPDCRIGWFLHTPFPSSEMYRVLPVRNQILQGLLGADLIGFQTYDYARHFLTSCSKLVSLNSHVTPKGMKLEDHFVSIGVFPIGIEPTDFSERLQLPETIDRITELCHSFRHKRVIIGVDRLDYIKGMPHKLLALERFYQRYPEMTKSVVLIQIGVPSRTNVKEYQHLATRVNELVGRINGTFGSLDHTPIYYINRAVAPHELVALYNIAAVCFITSVRDGMNLVSHEYVVCQDTPCPVLRDGPGVLVLSEFAGSAQSLSGAIRVNPWNTDEMATALYEALEMPLEERELRQTNAFKYVTMHTASFWARRFLADLSDAVTRSAAIEVPSVSRLPRQALLRAYEGSTRRVICCSDDRVMKRGKNMGLMHLLSRLSADPKNTVLMVSSQTKAFCASHFSTLAQRLILVAESGCFVKWPDEEQWVSGFGHELDIEWMNVVKPIMQYFTDRTPGSFIKVKETALTWHYRDTETEFGTMQARDMQVHLGDVLSSLPLNVLQMEKKVEVRLQGISKTRMINELLTRLTRPEDTGVTASLIDFLFCVGDDPTEEIAAAVRKDDGRDGTVGALLKEEPPSVSSLASALESSPLTPDANVYTCHIGTLEKQHIKAKYYLDSVEKFRSLLLELSDLSTEDYIVSS